MPVFGTGFAIFKADRRRHFFRRIVRCLRKPVLLVVNRSRVQIIVVALIR
jgi:hypothetical protein